MAFAGSQIARELYGNQDGGMRSLELTDITRRLGFDSFQFILFPTPLLPINLIGSCVSFCQFEPIGLQISVLAYLTEMLDRLTECEYSFRNVWTYQGQNYVVLVGGVIV